MGPTWQIEKKMLISHDWVRYRLDFMKKYTLKSIKYQKNKNFKYLFLIDKKTPSKLKKEIYDMNIGDISPIIYEIDCLWYDEGLNEVNSFLKSIIKKDYVITTTLDSDDLIHKDYVGAIQDEFDYQNFEFILFKHGYAYMMPDLFVRDVYVYNSFQSLIEKTKNMKSVNFMGHAAVREQKHRVSDNENPMWCRIIHDPTTTESRQSKIKRNDSGQNQKYVKYRSGDKVPFKTILDFIAP